jgi:hypothetical protein
MDAVRFADRIALELKPNNDPAVRKGLRQIAPYLDELDREYPGERPWEGYVVTYERP